MSQNTMPGSTQAQKQKQVHPTRHRHGEDTVCTGLTEFQLLYVKLMLL